MQIVDKIFFDPITKGLKFFGKHGSQEFIETHSDLGTAQIGFVVGSRSGRYTPTAAALINLDAAPVVSANTMLWSQIGKIVTCSGYVTVNPTTINTAAGFTLTLPVLPSSNFTTNQEANGVCVFSTSGGGSIGTEGAIYSSIGTKNVEVYFYATDVTSGRNFSYTFQYFCK